MFGFLLKLTILCLLVGWVLSRSLGISFRSLSFRSLWNGLGKRSEKAPYDDDAMATVREFLAAQHSQTQTIGRQDFYATRSELSLEETGTRKFLKESLHVWVFWSLVIPWILYGCAVMWALYLQGQGSFLVIALFVPIVACPFVATAMLPFGYDSPRDFSIKDILLIVFCGAVAAWMVSSIGEDPSREDADLRRLILLWPIYQVTLSFFGVLHWIKERCF